MSLFGKYDIIIWMEYYCVILYMIKYILCYIISFNIIILSNFRILDLAQCKIQWAISQKTIFGHNFWLECPPNFYRLFFCSFWSIIWENSWVFQNWSDFELLVIFFSFNGNFNGKMTKMNKMAKSHSKMVPKVSKWGF